MADMASSRDAAAQNREEALLESWLGAGDRRALEVVQSHVSAAVSQSAFDEAVVSNMVEFEMSMHDAVQDARATFAMQGRRVPQGMRYGADTEAAEKKEHNKAEGAKAEHTKAEGAKAEHAKKEEGERRKPAGGSDSV